MRNDIIFYGMVEAQGRVIDNNSEGSHGILVIGAPIFGDDIKTGDNIAVNGVCLTVQSAEDNQLTFHLWSATLEKTNLGQLKPGTALNLERNRYNR